MNEAEWIGCADPTPMLRFLIGTNHPRVQAVESFPDCVCSDRKLRLFACACYYGIHQLLPDIRARAAVEAAEQIADGLLPAEERQRAEDRVRAPLIELEGRWRASRGAQRIALLPTHEALALGGVILWSEAQKAAYYASSNAYLAFAALANPNSASSDKEFSVSMIAEKRVQTDVLRCIFGNQFCSAVLDQRWRTSDVLGVAQAIYEDRAFDRLPILADALMDAGCNDDAILGHCRSEGPHVRGCWVVDLALGKE